MSDLHAECYQDSHDEWRWRIKHRNGQTMADSGEGYRHRADMLSALAKLHPRIAVEWLNDSDPAKTLD